MKFYPLVALGLSILALHAEQPAAFVESFDRPNTDWKFQPENGGEWLQWVPVNSDRPAGWHFDTGGRVSAFREWPVGTRPFVLDFEVDLEKGRRDAWRLNGISLLVSSKPVYQMGPEDFGVAFTVMQSGVQASIKTGPIDEFERHEGLPDRPRNPNETYVANNASPRGVLNRGGAGGHQASWEWPGVDLANQKMRFRIERTESGHVRFSLYHSNGDPSEPVWEGVAELNTAFRKLNRTLDLQSIPLNYVNVLITVNNPPGNQTVPPAVNRLIGSLSNIVGITAPGTLPKVSGYSGPFAPGQTITVQGQSFAEGALVSINGHKQPTKRLDESRLEVRLENINSDGDNQLLVTNPDGGANFYPIPLRTGLAVDRILPAELRQVGGEVITLKGRGFGPETKVTFNGKPVEIVEVPDATTLKIKTPAGQPGRVNLEVFNGQDRFPITPIVAYAAHPYLLIQPDDVAKLRKRFEAPHMQHYRTVLLRNAERSADPAAMTPKAMMNPGYGEHIWATVWAYLLTQDPKYKEAAIRWIRGTVGPNDILRAQDPTASDAQRAAWKAAGGGRTSADPDPFSPGILIQNLDMHQFHIQRGAAVAMAYDILFEELDPALRGRMLEYMDRHIDLAERLIRADDWWYANNPSNTVTVANGSVALMALSHKTIRDDIPELAKLTSEVVKEQFRSLEEDGGSAEGTLYWNYGVGAQILHGLALQNTLGDDYGLLDDPRLERGIRFAETAIAGDGNMFVFNNSQPWLNGTVPAAFNASRYNQPLMRWLVDTIMERYAAEPTVVTEVIRPTYSVPAFLFRGDEPPEKNMPPLPTLAHLDRMQWGVMRSSPDAFKKGVVVGVKGMGGQATHHAQQDQGHYVLHAHGREFFLDAGYDKTSAIQHAIPLPTLDEKDFEKFDLKGVPQFNNLADAPIINVWEQGDLRTMTVDSTAAYSAKSDATQRRAEKVHRVFALAGEEAFVILDDVIPAKPDMPVYAQFQTARKPEIVDQRLRVERDGAQVTAHVFGPKLESPTVTPLDITKMGWIYKNMDVDWHRVTAKYTAKPDQPMVTVFLPSPNLEDKGEPKVTYAPDKITVTLPSGRNLVFLRQDDSWQLNKPSA